MRSCSLLQPMKPRVRSETCSVNMTLMCKSMNLMASLVIIDSVQGYQAANFYGVLRLIELLAVRAQKESKSGVFSIADMGSFFLFGREKELVNYELSIPKNMDITLRAFCCYPKNDFSLRLTDDQQRQLMHHHYRAISASTFYQG